ncbi:DUF433 domain-containing protein [uncultured Lamprocystis sp.]|jgi:uncharacterized protein (DUF433 family)|uniref:DUF433 domain-containing protein n=1 Tax=uncultured Lamprocystis sp. TaxID=543132 RepID=UPI0025F2FD49|nr:DUF433 domain-containing protein [uncultured Lamprocystis sp.]
MTIEHSRVFVSNRSQAVRLPKAVGFPPDVQGRPTVTLFDHPWPCTEAERYWDPSLQGITRIGDMIEEIVMQLALKTDPPPMQEDAHGVLRIAGTRVTLDSLVERYDQGASAEEIALSFESLNLHEVYAALGYYLAHRGALAAYLQQRRRAAVETRAQAERRCPPTEVRAWLAARREALHAAPPR